MDSLFEEDGLHDTSINELQEDHDSLEKRSPPSSKSPSSTPLTSNNTDNKNVTTPHPHASNKPGNSSEHISVSSESPTNVTTTPSPDPVLPDKGSAEAEKNSSMAIFFVLCVLAFCILLIHFMLLVNFQYLPESVVIVFLGALIGLIINLMSNQNIANWKKEEAFSPTAFFLVLLPPIIFESGYNLHKGNFFQNIGSILVFAIFGTLISALVVGGGVYLLGIADVAYQLSFVESLAFGSLISAVDPVATVAIFHALDADPVLNMLVFGESILNDAVAIVLTNTVLQAATADAPSTPGQALISGIGRYIVLFI